MFPSSYCRLLFVAALTSFVVAGCATTPSNGHPFLVRDLKRLSAGEERSDILGPGEAIDPRTGAPYRTYELRLKADEIVHIRATSPELPLGLSLFRPDGFLLSASDQPADGGTSLVSKIPDTGTYLLVVSARASGELGSYRLRMDPVEMVSRVGVPSLVRGHLFDSGRRHPMTEAYMNSYDLEVDDEVFVEIKMQSSSFDTYLSLVSSDGEVIAENDDFGGTTDSRVLVQLLPGSYEVWTSSFGHGRAGAYSLSLEAVEVRLSESLTVGSPFLAFLGSEREQVPSSDRLGQPFSFTIATRGLYEIMMDTEDFDAYLVLADAEGNVVAEDDDSGAGTNARIAGALEPGSYTVWATSYMQTDSGRYSLTVQEFNPPEPSGELSVGSRVTGRLDVNSSVCRRRGSRVDYYELTLESEARIDIQLSSDEFDTYLVLEDSAGNLLDENDDTALSTDSQIVATLTPGTYRIGATAFDESELGTYTLSVSLAEQDD